MANDGKDLVLYVKAYCPYCVKVLRYMSDHDIQMPVKDVLSDASSRAELVDVGGKNQAPCLFVDGKPLYESDDIIAFLRDEFVE